MKRKAILVIDMQRGLVLGAYRQNELVSTVNDLIRRARVQAVPVIFVQHNHATFEPMMRGARGWQIFDRLEQRPEDLVVEKDACDGFYHTRLAEELRSLAVGEVIVTGLQTEYCVDTSCRAALNLGFDVVLAADAHSTGDSTLSAVDVVAHHNALLANLVHPHSKIRVQPAAEIDLAPFETAQN